MNFEGGVALIAGGTQRPQRRDKQNESRIINHSCRRTHSRSAASAWPVSSALRAAPRSDPVLARNDSWLDPHPAACRPCVRSDENRPRRTQCPLSDRQAPAVFSNDCLQRFTIKTQVGDQLLQPAILIFHLP
jgi:hypothetical protein